MSSRRCKRASIHKNGVLRYCSRCKKTVMFIDSQKRRQNANGRKIHEYAIYKCGRDHTWNRKIRTSRV